MKKVRPEWAHGYNVSWNLNLFSGPKWAIKCGECGHTFKERIMVVDNPTVICPACRTLNELSGLVVGSLMES